MAFYLFLFLVIFLGIISLVALDNFSGVTDQIGDRWLPNTRYLGDLNNYTSDFRAAEGGLLLASSPDDIKASEKEIDQLDHDIAKAQHGYEQIYHEKPEADLYKVFSKDWNEYRSIADQVLAFVRVGSRERGIALYKTSSRIAYNAASDTLGKLTEFNVAKDHEARHHALETYYQVRLFIVIAMISGILLVACGVMYIRRSISAPMLDLAGSMHRLAHYHTHHMPVDINSEATKRQDEVGEMARSLVVFRNNVVELAESRQGLIRQASMLEEKLQHERSLMAIQSNFISVVSHEFRTPLTIIDGHAQRLISTKDSLQVHEIVERVGKIRGAVKQVTTLIDNQVNSSRFFECKPDLYFHPTDINLSEILQQVCHEYAELSSAAHIVVTIDEKPLMMFGDPKLLQQTFGNILSNAIKYSPEGGPIEVKATRVSEGIVVMVEDHGIGIPPKDKDQLFGRYFRGSNVAHISGTGIGLYLAKMIVELHGGRIMVESTEGEGTRFSIHF